MEDVDQQVKNLEKLNLLKRNISEMNEEQIDQLLLITYKLMK